MKTTTLDVGGMLSILDCRTVGTQLGKIPGVYHATASTASSSMIAEYDEAVTSVAASKDKINERGLRLHRRNHAQACLRTVSRARVSQGMTDLTQSQQMSGTGAILAINCGSSSVKFALYDAGQPLLRFWSGCVDRIGLPDAHFHIVDARVGQ